MEWDPDDERVFEVPIRVHVKNVRGILARVASEIAATDTNIENVVSVNDDYGPTATMSFTIQVKDRNHLARVMRNIRRLPETLRILRVKD